MSTSQSKVENTQGAQVVDALLATLGADKVISDSSTTALLSKDLSPPDQQCAALVVVRPTSIEDIINALEIAVSHSMSACVRGGGMSYTGGYQPGDANTLLLDMSHLSGVVEVSEEDRFMIVDAGCTWQAVDQALSQTGLRTQLRGPISGVVSTVGGACSQNLPGSMDGVVALEVVTAEGEVIRTGSLGAHAGSGFYRNYGPDLTGLFLGDNGTLGIKTKVALRLEPVPVGLSHASFAFDTMQDIAAAMSLIAQSGLAKRMFGLDPLKNKTATKVDTREGLDTLKKIATGSSKGLASGLKDAAKVAVAGKKAFDHVEWSLHVSTEGVDQVAADAAMGRVNEICLKTGRSIEPYIPVAMAAKPYSVRGFLGMKGERWVPLHGIFPFSKVTQAITETQKFFQTHEDLLAQHGIVHSFMLSAGDGYYLIEPMFYWSDALLPLHEATLGAEKMKKFNNPQSRPDAQSVVSRLRSDLRDLYFDLGALSAQVGSFYRFKETIQPTALNLLKSVKASVDPSDMLSRQNLGLLE